MQMSGMAVKHTKDPGDHAMSADCWCNPEVIKVEAVADHPALDEPQGIHAKGTLAEWLYNRFGTKMEPLDPTETAKTWDRLEAEDQSYWAHQAYAVRRAVERVDAPYKPKPEQDDTELVALAEDQTIRALHHVHEICGGEVKGFRQLNLKAAESMGEAIRIAVGAASTCWTNMMGAGVFKSTEALDISTQLEHHIDAHITKGLGAIGLRHNVIGAKLRALKERGETTVPIQDVMDILVGKKDQEAHSTVPYNVEKARCWCGSDVGPRLPSDPWGNGCLADIKHDWAHETPEAKPAPKTPGYDGPEGTEWGGTAR
jgi:hypothetical protein